MNRKLLVAVCAVGVLSFHCGSPSTNDAGSGGGGSGGGRVDAGTGGGGGGAAGACDPAPAFVATDLNGKAGFDPGGTPPPPPPYNFATMVRNSATAGRFDVMFNEYYADGTVMNFALPATTYQQCSACLVIQTSCDGSGANCAKIYLAQRGTFSVSAATKSPDAGTYAFTLSNMTYQAWDFTADVAIDGGCLTLPSFTFTGVWP